jgi:hypothetical protein
MREGASERAHDPPLCLPVVQQAQHGRGRVVARDGLRGRHRAIDAGVFFFPFFFQRKRFKLSRLSVVLFVTQERCDSVVFFKRKEQAQQQSNRARKRGREREQQRSCSKGKSEKIFFGFFFSLSLLDSSLSH